jgi:hypothetical protein
MFKPDAGVEANAAIERVKVDSQTYATPNWLKAVESDSQIRVATLPPLLQATTPIEEWTTALQTEFRQLAIKEAEDKISRKEVNRLEELSTLRRVHQHPRSADEVLWEFEQRKLTKHLLATLKSYVEFYEGASEAWRSPKESSDRQ